MSKLMDSQIKFTLMIGQEIIFAYSIGYGLTFGESYDDDGVGHMKDSLHYIRLAQDFNVCKDGKLLIGKDSEIAHNKLHDYWDTLGGAKRIEKDLNHYSLEFQGKR
jgi:hypothetical protein